MIARGFELMLMLMMAIIVIETRNRLVFASLIGAKFLWLKCYSKGGELKQVHSFISKQWKKGGEKEEEKGKDVMIGKS